MVAISIRTNFPAVQSALERMHVGIRDRALASAVNKTLALAKTEMARTIVSEFNVKTDYVRERLRIRRASAKQKLVIEGALVGSGRNGESRSANLIAFVEKTTTLAAARRRRKAGTLDQLYVKIKRRGGAKPLAGAFIGNKGRTVFERVPGTTMASRGKYAGKKSGEQIRPVQTINVGQMFNTRRINRVVVDVMLRRFEDVFVHEARFFIERFNRGAK